MKFSEYKNQVLTLCEEEDLHINPPDDNWLRNYWGKDFSVNDCYELWVDTH